MMSFEYRCLDLIAEYETRFSSFPAMFFHHIEPSTNIAVRRGFHALLDAMCQDATENLGKDMTDHEFGTKLGELGDRDLKAIKLVSDLGQWSQVVRIILTYFVSRRNLLDDERAWVRFTNLIDDEISIQAC